MTKMLKLTKNNYGSFILEHNHHTLDMSSIENNQNIILPFCQKRCFNTVTTLLNVTESATSSSSKKFINIGIMMVLKEREIQKRLLLIGYVMKIIARTISVELTIKGRLMEIGKILITTN